MSEHLIGRLCTKLAGRESSRQAIIVDVLEGNFVLIDGQVKRRRCNLAHLELSPKQLPIQPASSSAEIAALFEQEGIVIKQQKSRTPREKPMRKRAVQKVQPSTEKATAAHHAPHPEKSPEKSKKHAPHKKKET